MTRHQGSIAIPLVAALVLVVVGGLWWYRYNLPVETTAKPEPPLTTSATEQQVVTPDPADSSSVSVPASEPADTDSAAAGQAGSGEQTGEQTRVSELSAEAAGIDVLSLGAGTISDENFAYLTELMRNDPMFRASVLETMRSTQDATQAERLARLLGQFPDQSISEVASGMVFSGDDASQKTGLLLLGLQQPVSPYARAEILNIMQTDSRDSTKIAAMNALARPTAVTAENRAPVVQQLNNLVQADNPAVRRQAVSVLSRWGEKDQTTPTLIAALADESPEVRSTAVYALSRSKARSADAKQALLDYLARDEELVQGLRGAVSTLQKFELTEEESAWVRKRAKELERR